MNTIFGILFAVVYLSIWIFVVLKTVRAFKTAKRTGSMQLSRESGFVNRFAQKEESSYAPVKDGSGSMQLQPGSGKGFDLGWNSNVSAMEDRQHDWLARQLAEERRYNKLDLGAAHDLECAAEELSHISRKG